MGALQPVAQSDAVAFDHDRKAGVRSPKCVSMRLKAARDALGAAACGHQTELLRSLGEPPLTPFTDRVRLTAADERAYAAYAGSERHKGFEVIDVGFDPPPESTVHQRSEG
jgi:hypothetical protein